MRLTHSKHWKRKKKHRPNITDDLIKHAIRESNTIRDKHWTNAYNAIYKLPQNAKSGLQEKKKQLQDNNSIFGLIENERDMVRRGRRRA